jgi:hypothetical protein
VYKVRGKEQYRTNCIDRPLELNPIHLLPKESRNKAVRHCRRDILQDKERYRVVL